MFEKIQEISEKFSDILSVKVLLRQEGNGCCKHVKERACRCQALIIDFKLFGKTICQYLTGYMCFLFIILKEVQADKSVRKGQRKENIIDYSTGPTKSKDR